MFAISKSNQELFDMYGLILENGVRFYKMPLDKRVYGYERSSVKRFIVEGKDITESSWGTTVANLANYLQNKYPKPIEELISFYC